MTIRAKRVAMSLCGVLICAVAITMAEKWHWGQFRFIRITTDLVCVVLGSVCFLAGAARGASSPPQWASPPSSRRFSWAR